MIRGLRGVIASTGALLVLTACSSGSQEPGPAQRTSAAPDPGSIVADAVETTTAEGTGVYSVTTGLTSASRQVGGSFDLAAGTQDVEATADVGTRREPDYRRIGLRRVGDRSFFRIDDYDDATCWVDVSRKNRFASAPPRTPGLISLIESIEAVSLRPSGHELDVTVPVGLVGDVLSGLAAERVPARAEAARAVRTKASIRIGTGAVLSVTVQLADVLAALDAAGADLDLAMGDLLSREGLVAAEFMTVELGSLGLPVTIEEPSAGKIGTDPRQAC